MLPSNGGLEILSSLVNAPSYPLLPLAAAITWWIVLPLEVPLEGVQTSPYPSPRGTGQKREVLLAPSGWCKLERKPTTLLLARYTCKVTLCLTLEISSSPNWHLSTTSMVLINWCFLLASFFPSCLHSPSFLIPDSWNHFIGNWPVPVCLRFAFRESLTKTDRQQQSHQSLCSIEEGICTMWNNWLINRTFFYLLLGLFIAGNTAEFCMLTLYAATLLNSFL